MEAPKQEDYQEKAFYSAMISAWLNTKLELDKQLLGLSVTIMGLLTTLLRTVGAANQTQIISYILAFLFFFVTIISIIVILDGNAKHIESVLQNKESKSTRLEIFDNVARASFVLGMLVLVIIGLTSITTHTDN